MSVHEIDFTKRDLVNCVRVYAYVYVMLLYDQIKHLRLQFSRKRYKFSKLAKYRGIEMTPMYIVYSLNYSVFHFRFWFCRFQNS